MGCNSMNEMDSHALKVSVVVPTYQRRRRLQHCLESLAPDRQTLPGHLYEVIVADDNPDESIRKHIQQFFPWVRWHRSDHCRPAGPAGNRNAAARLARGSWLAFIDDDCVADRGWLANIMHNAHETDADIIEGRVVCSQGPDHPLFHFVENLAGSKYWTCNLTIRAASFRNIGGFDERFLCGEDTDLAERLVRSGARAKFAKDVMVEHPPTRISLLTYIRRLFRAERWNTCLLVKHNFTGARHGWPGLAHIALHLILDRCRGLWHLLSQPEPRRRRQLSEQLWLTFLYPVIFFYQLYWWVAFSNVLDKQGHRSAASQAVKTGA